MPEQFVRYYIIIIKERKKNYKQFGRGLCLKLIIDIIFYAHTYTQTFHRRQLIIINSLPTFYYFTSIKL